ncbi:MAG: hypothetical protein ACE5HO_07495 [bacterium]
MQISWAQSNLLINETNGDGDFDEACATPAVLDLKSLRARKVLKLAVFRPEGF